MCCSAQHPLSGAAWLLFHPRERRGWNPPAAGPVAMGVGPLSVMSISLQSNEDIRHLFCKHVPEVAAGKLELVSIARECGKQLVVAVRSLDSSVHPVSVLRPVHLKSISRELGGERISVVLWSESPANFILHALAPYGPSGVRMPRVTLDAGAQQARVEVGRETLAYFFGEHETQLRLASALVGWDIQLVCHEQN
jgi:transcription termination/antitermination protein NusA